MKNPLVKIGSLLFILFMAFVGIAALFEPGIAGGGIVLCLCSLMFAGMWWDEFKK